MDWREDELVLRADWDAARHPRVPGGRGGGRFEHAGTGGASFSFDGPPGGTGHARAMESLAKVLDREPGQGETAQTLRAAISSMMARDLPAARRHMDGAIYQDQLQGEGKFRGELEAVKASLDRVPRAASPNQRLPRRPGALAGSRKGLDPGVISGDASGAPAQSSGYETQRWDAHLHPRGRDGKFAGKDGGVGAASKVYNDIPETRGTPRGKGIIAGGQAREDDAAVAAWRAGHPVAPPITKDEARDGARPVSAAEFQSLAREGQNQLGVMSASRQPITAMDHDWDKIKTETHAKVLQSWGGATINPHTGEALPDGSDKFALTVKGHGIKPVSVHENPSAAEFSAAMDRAKAQFRGELEKGSHYLGVFHDDDEHRIDIDPVVVVDSRHEVETIGAYTHAIGGAYHFRTGDGFWPPYVDPEMGGAA